LQGLLKTGCFRLTTINFRVFSKEIPLLKPPGRYAEIQISNSAMAQPKVKTKVGNRLSEIQY